MALVGRCQFCRAPLQVTLEGGKWKQLSPCACDRPAGAAPPPPVPALPRTVAEKVATRQVTGKGRKHYAAVRTLCLRQHSHDSKGEARTCDELHRRYARVFVRIPPMPLLTIAPRPDGRPFTLKVDFCVEGQGGREWIDAKHPTAKVRRGWPEKKAAFEAVYGPVREVWVSESGVWSEAGRP